MASEKSVYLHIASDMFVTDKVCSVCLILLYTVYG